VSTTDAILEFTNTAVLPDVRFRQPGRYAAIVGIGTASGETADLDRVRVPFAVWTPDKVAGQLGQPLDTGLDALIEELGRKLSPDAQRVLRFAAVEARRLGRGSIYADHLLVALGRVLGPRSGLSRPALLRDV